MVRIFFGFILVMNTRDDKLKFKKSFTKKILNHRRAFISLKVVSVRGINKIHLVVSGVSDSVPKLISHTIT